MTLNTNTPHIDPEWADAFLLELRLQGVAGNRIGAALAEVEAHCAESGESAQAAYGDPVEFARALDLPTSPDQQITLAADLAPAALGLGGMLATLNSLGSWRLGERVDVSWGLLGSVALILLMAVAIVRFAEPLLRLIVERRWSAYVMAVAPILIFVLVLMLGRATVFTLPVLPVLIVGLILLASSTGLYLVARRRGRLGDDVTGPEALGEDAPGTLTSDVPTKVAGNLTPYLFPLLTALMAIPLWLLG